MKNFILEMSRRNNPHMPESYHEETARIALSRFPEEIDNILFELHARVNRFK